MLFRASLVLLALVAACSDDNSKKPIDAPAPDAPPTTVVAVTCPATPAATIMTSDATFSYAPTSASITIGQVVKFQMSMIHNVVPDTGNDPGLKVDFNETKCLMFTHVGTFKFHCAPHSFAGMVMVN